MLLGSDNASVLLINAIEDGNELLVGLFFAEPTKEVSVMVTDPAKALVYKVFMPEGFDKFNTHQTGLNIRLKFEKV